MSIFELSALAAAVCWALNGMIAIGPSQAVGAIRFNQMRMSMVFVMLVAYVSVFGGWETLDTNQALLIVLSGFIGIFVGDTALFLSLNRLGPRRSAILFAMNAPMSAVLGWIFLGEYLSGQKTLGIVATIIGVMLAIAFGKRRAQQHYWEAVRGPLWVGLALGTGAALAQAVGSLIARPVLAAGADPVAVSAARIGVAALGLTLLVAFWKRVGWTGEPFTRQTLAMTALSGFIGMAVGMTLIMFALVGGKVGIVTTLAATTPAMMLPLLWLKTGEVPAAGAWIGAGLVVGGCGLIFTG